MDQLGRQAFGERGARQGAVVIAQGEIKRGDAETELDHGLRQQRLDDAGDLTAAAMAMEKLAGGQGMNLQALGRRRTGGIVQPGMGWPLPSARPQKRRRRTTRGSGGKPGADASREDRPERHARGPRGLPLDPRQIYAANASQDGVGGQARRSGLQEDGIAALAGENGVDTKGRGPLGVVAIGLEVERHDARTRTPPNDVEMLSGQPQLRIGDLRQLNAQLRGNGPGERALVALRIGDPKVQPLDDLVRRGPVQRCRNNRRVQSTGDVSEDLVGVGGQRCDDVVDPHPQLGLKGGSVSALPADVGRGAPHRSTAQLGHIDHLPWPARDHAGKRDERRPAGEVREQRANLAPGDPHLWPKGRRGVLQHVRSGEGRALCLPA